MKGLLFVEFIEFLEIHTDLVSAQEIINQAELDSLGAYTRVGLYDYQELIKLLVSAANRLDLSADELLDRLALFGSQKLRLISSKTCTAVAAKICWCKTACTSGASHHIRIP